jgi:hypothetical protein
MNTRLKPGTKVMVPYNVRHRSKFKQGLDLGDRPCLLEATVEDSFETNGEFMYYLRFSDNSLVIGIPERKFTISEKQVVNKKVVKKAKR